MWVFGSGGANNYPPKFDEFLQATRNLIGGRDFN
jgi:hypothetical protein